MLSLPDISAAFRWWAILALIGLAATPLTLHLLKVLPDRGYAIVKMVGLLLAGYIFWLLGSLGLLNNSAGGLLFGLIALVTLSVLAVFRLDSGEDSIKRWLRDHWRYVVTVEILFALIFFGWTWVRSQNPAIAATEKPMEFAFLNSLGRSPGFPPLDPWLSGFGISYYYFGYLMTSMVARLAAVPEQIAFNLAIAWLAAGTAVGAFGLVYNLIAADKTRMRRWAVMIGLIAAISLPIAGNLEIVLEVLYANDVGSDSFWQWLDIRDLNEPAAASEVPRYETTSWWWWRSSRVIHEYHLSGRPEEGLEPIAEFPAFSLILGDLHAHLLALPFAYLSLALALVWWLRTSRPYLDFSGWFERQGLKRQLRAISWYDAGLLLFTAAVLGGLSFLNTWDVLIHLFVVVGAFILAQWRVDGRWHAGLIRQAVTVAVLLAGLAIVLYLPFYLGLRSQAAPPYLLPMIMRPTRLAHFLVIFGMPLIAIVGLLAVLSSWLVRHRDRSSSRRTWLTATFFTVGLVAALLLLMLFLGWLVASSIEGMPVVLSLSDELGLGLEALPAEAGITERAAWALSAMGKIAPQMFAARLTQPALILLLAAMLASTIYILLRLLLPHSEEMNESWRRIASPTLPFVLLLMATAVLLTLGPEFVYLRDNFGQRINTIFKFYYQAWILFGIAALYALAYLLSRFRLSGIVIATLYFLALAGSLLFPFFAIQSRAQEYRGPTDSENRLTATLNGLAYLQQLNPDEYEAIMWLRQNVSGSPVILEAVGGQYSAYGRVSAATGIPTVLGWAGHEYQWRGATPEPAERDSAVTSIFSQMDWPSTELLLDRYDVQYVYFGQLERNTYDPQSEEKFQQNMDVAFQNNNVTIYQRPVE